MKAIILAAGMGTRLGGATRGMPKCMVEVGGISLIDRLIQRFGEVAIEEVIVVTGFGAEDLKAHVANIDHPLAKSAVFVFNDHFSDMGNFYSLLVAQEAVAGHSFIRVDGDVLIDTDVLPQLLAGEGLASLAVESKSGMGDEEMKIRVDSKGAIVELNKHIDPDLAVGEFIGIDRISAEFSDTIFSKLRDLIELGETHEYYERAYELLIQAGNTDFEVVDITGCLWTEIDDATDLEAAQKLVVQMMAAAPK